MLAFFDTFTQSFKLALLLWPLIAATSVLPIFLWFYIRRKKIENKRMFMLFLVILYVLGLLAFTLYPIPNDPVAYCSTHSVTPQIVPFHLVRDVMDQGFRAVLQVVMNIVFFVPIGIFARVAFGWSLRRTALVGFVASCTVETLQLTGALGIYPCSYRLFDVDDLMMNTLGSLIGYAMVLRLPRMPALRTDLGDDRRWPDVDRYTISLYCDALITYVASRAVIEALAAASVRSAGISIAVSIVSALVFCFVVPYLRKGQSIGGAITRSALVSAPFTIRRYLTTYGVYAVFGIVLQAGGLSMFVVALGIYAYLFITKRTV